MLGEFGWKDTNTRNSVYEAWTNAVLSEGAMELFSGYSPEGRTTALTIQTTMA